MSIGLAMAKVAVYSTMPRALRDGELDIGDDLVVRVFGIEFAGEVASKEFVLAGFSEDLATIGRGSRGARW